MPLEEEVEKRTRLLNEDNELNNPEDSVHSLDELNNSTVYSARDSFANLLEPKERSIGNAIANTGAIIGSLGVSGKIRGTAYDAMKH